MIQISFICIGHYYLSPVQQLKTVQNYSIKNKNIYHCHQHHRLISQPVLFTRIKTIPSIYWCGPWNLVSFRLTASEFSFQAFFSNVLAVLFDKVSLLYICYVQFFSFNMFIMIMIFHSKADHNLIIHEVNRRKTKCFNEASCDVDVLLLLTEYEYSIWSVQLAHLLLANEQFFQTGHYVVPRNVHLL